MSLCEKCIKLLLENDYRVRPIDHCHHDEPEKPEGKCWCNYPDYFRHISIYAKESSEFPWNDKFECLYCPKCGKSREEWGK